MTRTPIPPAKPTRSDLATQRVAEGRVPLTAKQAAAYVRTHAVLARGPKTSLDRIAACEAVEDVNAVLTELRAREAAGDLLALPVWVENAATLRRLQLSMADET